MTLPAGSHPPPERLAALVDGRLGDAEFAAVIAHITDCPECCARLERIPTDPMVSQIRAAASSDGEDRDERRDAVQAIRDGLPRTRDAPANNATLLETAKFASDTSDGTRLPTPTEEPPRPQQVGGYEILEEIGRGGMGVVYRARHIGLNRPAAVKMVLTGRLADRSDRLRLRLEAELAARVHHPNVVHVYDVGEYEGSPYLAMEWIAGGTLEHRLSDRPWAADDAARLVQTVAGAVQAAHDEGVLHRDLKPANILLDNGEMAAGGSSGTSDSGTNPIASRSLLHAKVADFGLARPLHGPGLTQSGFVAGTPAYMAPEQLTTGGAAVGPAVDVYALGVTLYRLLSGRLPFEGSGALEVLTAASTFEPPRPRRFNRSIPRDVESVCLKCLEKEPHRRYASARELAEDLARFRAGRPVMARRVGVVARTMRWCRRNPGTAVLLAALAAVVLTGFGLVTWKWLETDELRRVAEDRQGLADERRREAQLNLYRSNVRLAKQAVDSSQFVFARDLLAKAANRHDGDEDLRGFEWYYLDRLANPVIETIIDHPGQVTCAAVSGDGRLVACACEDHVVRVTDTAVKQEVFSVPTPPDGRVALAFSGDGSRFAASLGRDVHVWDTRTWKRVGEFQPGGSFHIALRPDGRRLTAAGGDGDVEIWDVDAARRVGSFNPGAPTRGLTYSPEGGRLAIAGADGAVRVCDSETGGQRLSYPVGNGATYPPGIRQPVAFSPDGRAVATVNKDRNVYIMDVETPKHVQTIPAGPYEFVYGLAFSPGGGVVATADGKGTVRVWEIATGQRRMTLKEQTADVLGLAIIPDGRVVTVSREGRIELWEPGASLGSVSLESAGAKLTSVAFSPDGQRVAAGTATGPIKVWEVETGRTLFTVRGHDKGINGVAFTPDGGRLVSVGGDGVGRVWDASNGQSLFELTGHTAPIAAVAVSQDGRRLATGGEDGTVHIWDAGTRESLRVLTGGKQPISRLSFSPDGRRLAAGSTTQPFRVWEVESGELVPLPMVEQASVTYGPNGRLAMTGYDSAEVRVWDLESGRSAFTLRGHARRIPFIAFSADGRRIATAGIDGTLRIWDAADGHELLTLSFPANCLAFSPDGRRIAAGSGDTVRLWEGFALPRELLIRGRLTD